MKKAYLKTYGCQMNEQDSLQMHTLLDEVGYEKTLDPFEAELILINTCAIREKAVHKMYSDLGRIKQIKEDRPDLIVGVAGCVAEQEKEIISKRFPFLDMVFGPDHIRHLPKMLKEIADKKQDKGKTLLKTGFDLRKDFQFVNVLPNAEETPVKALVTIQKGCDNICSFCIVPFVRGREVSRPYQQIIDEINSLVDRNVKEVTLLGQNVNSYGWKSEEGVSFAKLLELIAQKTNLKRLRFTTSHPKDVKEDLIDQFVNNPILVPQFHLPVQSGSSAVLEAMRRQYTCDDYKEIIDKLKSKIPNFHFTTDIIVGFPTETEKDFEATLALMNYVRYDLCYSFAYSPRPYTSAIKLIDDVSKEEKSRRLQILQELSDQHTLERNQLDVGTIQEVLVETKEETDSLSYKGRTQSNKVVHFSEGDYQPGDFVNIKINKANPYSLAGERA